MKENILKQAQEITSMIESLKIDDKVDLINRIKLMLHKVSPMSTEPVDCVLWVRNESVFANDYNPNKVAPPEMALLETSIWEDGYTMPCVCYYLEDEDVYEIVDGYHRYTVLLSSDRIREREKGLLPVVVIDKDVTNRMASTIRHNRARGSHSVELMSNIVGELVESGMSDGWILRHIGMDKDELLRLKQITGLTSLFKDTEFTTCYETDKIDNEFIEI